MQAAEIERQQQTKRMTYQLALAGCDGIVIGSDQCERIVSSNGQFAAKNMVRKLTIDQTSRFAWACSGSVCGKGQGWPAERPGQWKAARAPGKDRGCRQDRPASRTGRILAQNREADGVFGADGAPGGAKSHL
jgi:hypothetical protein